MRVRFLALWAMWMCVSGALWAEEAHNTGADTPVQTTQNMSDDEYKPVYRSLKRDSLPKGFARPFVWLGRYITNSNKQEFKKFDCTVLGGPFYNSVSGLSIAGGVSGMYSWDRSDPTLQRSSVSINFAAGLTGMMQVGLRGSNFMKGDRYRWDYKLVLYYLPTKFWGIGYDQGYYDKNEAEYKQLKFVFQPYFLFRAAPHFFVGPKVDMMLSDAYDFGMSKEGVDSQTFLTGKRGQQDDDVNTFGAGIVWQYDSRDFTLNASRGHFFKVEQLFYPKFMNKYYFNRTDICYSTYFRPYRSAILAFEAHGQYNYSSTNGDVPWTYLSMSGEANRLRGYYEGRYRDNGIVQAQIELRQHIWKRWGCAIWVGGGNVFHNFNTLDWDQFLPNYGVGLRWEMKRRVNIRMDFGFTKNNPGFCFNIGEAF